MKTVNIKTEPKSASKWFTELIDKHRLTKDNQIHSAVVMWEYNGRVWKAQLNCKYPELAVYKGCLEKQIYKEVLEEAIEEMEDERGE